MRWETFWLCALFTLLAVTIVGAKVRDVQQEPTVILKGLNVISLKTPTNLALQSGPPSGGGPLFQTVPQRVAISVTPSEEVSGESIENKPPRVAPAKTRMMEAPERPTMAVAPRPRGAKATRTGGKKKLYGPASLPTELFDQALPPSPSGPSGIGGFAAAMPAPGKTEPRSAFAPEAEPASRSRPHVAIPLSEGAALTVGSASTLWPSNKVIETRSQSLNAPEVSDRVGREEDEDAFSGAALGLKFKLN